MRYVMAEMINIIDDFKRNAGIGSLEHVLIFLELMSLFTLSNETGLKLVIVGRSITEVCKERSFVTVIIFQMLSIF